MEIMDAAYKVFSEKGYHRARIEDIAAETGMAQGLFYRYFRNKQDVFNQILEDIISRITAGISFDVPEASNTLEEYVAQMKRGIDNLFDIFVEDPLISRFLFFEAFSVDEEASRRIRAAQRLFVEYSMLYVRNGMEKGFLRRDLHVEETAHAFNALILEGARQVARSSDRPKTRERWKEAIVDLMIKGTAKNNLLG
jgi:AcrR family transcriptional regulator